MKFLDKVRRSFSNEYDGGQHVSRRSVLSTDGSGWSASFALNEDVMKQSLQFSSSYTGSWECDADSAKFFAGFALEKMLNYPVYYAVALSEIPGCERVMVASARRNPKESQGFFHYTFPTDIGPDELKKFAGDMQAAFRHTVCFDSVMATPRFQAGMQLNTADFYCGEAEQFLHPDLDSLVRQIHKEPENFTQFSTTEFTEFPNDIAIRLKDAVTEFPSENFTIMLHFGRRDGSNYFSINYQHGVACRVSRVFLSSVQQRAEEELDRGYNFLSSFFGFDTFDLKK